MEGLGFRPLVVARPRVKGEAIASARAILPTCQFDEAACDLGLKRLRHYRKEWDDDHGVWKDRPAMTTTRTAPMPSSHSLVPTTNRHGHTNLLRPTWRGWCNDDYEALIGEHAGCPAYIRGGVRNCGWAARRRVLNIEATSQPAGPLLTHSIRLSARLAVLNTVPVETNALGSPAAHADATRDAGCVDKWAASPSRTLSFTPVATLRQNQAPADNGMSTPCRPTLRAGRILSALLPATDG
jgi:hypothetical protein